MYVLKIQLTILQTLNNITKAIAPILCHTAEDCYQHHPLKGSEKSVFTTGWMIQKSEWDNKEISKTFQLLLDLKSEVYKLIEKARANK
jgi:isoleucyl-tRNA synthetase